MSKSLKPQLEQILLRIRNGESKSSLASEYGVSLAVVESLLQEADASNETQPQVSSNSSKYQMMPMKDATSLVIQKAAAYDASNMQEFIDLNKALGKVLAADVKSVSAIPAYRTSIMDGYAIHTLDNHGAGNVRYETKNIA